MEAFVIRGGRRLEGALRVDGAKNAVLPIMAAACMTKETVRIRACPQIVDARIMLEILEKITDGRGELEDLDKLETLAKNIQASALCGLGQTAPNPILSTLRYFRDEYVAHVVDKKCPAGVCKNLIQIKINPDLCKSCGICSKICPATCISGEKKVPYQIDQSRCLKCGACIEKCPFKAIGKES